MCVRESRYEYERLCVRDRVYKRKKGVCVCVRESMCASLCEREGMCVRDSV